MVVNVQCEWWFYLDFTSFGVISREWSHESVSYGSKDFPALPVFGENGGKE